MAEVLRTVEVRFGQWKVETGDGWARLYHGMPAFYVSSLSADPTVLVDTLDGALRLLREARAAVDGRMPAYRREALPALLASVEQQAADLARAVAAAEACSTPKVVHQLRVDDWGADVGALPGCAELWCRMPVDGRPAWVQFADVAYDGPPATTVEDLAALFARDVLVHLEGVQDPRFAPWLAEAQALQAAGRTALAGLV